MTVRVETTDMAGAVMLVTLDRPSRRNAVDPASQRFHCQHSQCFRNAQQT